MTRKEITLFSVWGWFELLRKRKANAQRMRDSYPANRDKRQAANAAYAAAHPEVVAEAKQRWYLRNKLKVAEASRIRYLRDPGEAKARVKKWRAENPERRKVWRDRSKQDAGWRIRQSLAVRLWNALKTPACKSARTLELLGCSVPELRTHLATQFQFGMTWDSYGDWHIDHIRPCASFDLTQPDQQRECFNFKNLQPLWAKDNLSKGAKYNAP